MNLVVLSGTLSDMAEVKELSENNMRVDGCLLKHYTMDNGAEFTKKFFFYASGKMATRFMQDFEAGDSVIISGKLTAYGDENGSYATKIVVQSMDKLSEEDKE